MNGTGVGFSVEEDYVKKLPIVPEELFATDTTIVVADSKLGWARAFKELISLLYGGHIPKWDVSKIRPAGAPLKTFGGRASGPAPLVDLFNFTVASFCTAVGRKLKPIEAHDIVCKTAEIVVVGGSISKAWDLFEEEMNASAKKYIISTQAKKTKIVRAKLGDDAGALGAAYLI